MELFKKFITLDKSLYQLLIQFLRSDYYRLLSLALLILLIVQVFFLNKG